MQKEKKNISKSMMMLKEMYSTDLMADKKINIDKDGSLALLAYGYKGLVEWRKVRMVNTFDQGELDNEK